MSPYCWLPLDAFAVHHSPLCIPLQVFRLGHRSAEVGP
jgi:hypothetical protein